MPELKFQYPATIDDHISQLTASRDYVLCAMDAVAERPDARPVPERWSAAEVLYHLYLTEKGVLAGLRKVLKSGERHERKHDKYLLREWEAINSVAMDREIKFTAPAHLDPRDFPAIQEIRRLLDETRARVIEFVRASSIDQLASYSFPHPSPQVGDLTGAGWLAILVMHDVRHGRQIEEAGQAAAV